MIVVLEDSGKNLKVWKRNSIRKLELNSDFPDLTINSSNAKKVALAMLKHYPAKVVAYEEGVKPRLLVAVEVRTSTFEALKALTRVKRITDAKVKELLKRPTPRNVLKSLMEAS